MNKPFGAGFGPRVQLEHVGQSEGVLLLDQSILEELPLASLETLARSLEKQARTLREFARKRRALEQVTKGRAAFTRTLFSLPHVVMKHMAGGLSYDAAVQAAARESALPAETIEAQFRVWLKGDDIAAKNARRLAVSRMAYAGASNQDIAARLGVHRNTVGKDLKWVLKS